MLLAQPVLPSRLEHGSCRKATPGFTPSVPPIVGGGLPLAMACVGLYFVAPTQQALRRIKELLIDPDCAGIAVPIGDAFSSSTIRRHRCRDSRTRRRVTR